MEAGIFISGLFVSSQEFEDKREDGSIRKRTAVLIAIGTAAYRVYLRDNAWDDFEGVALGDHVTLSVRPVAGKNGVSFVSGYLVG